MYAGAGAALITMRVRSAALCLKIRYGRSTNGACSLDVGREAGRNKRAGNSRNLMVKNWLTLHGEKRLG